MVGVGATFRPGEQKALPGVYTRVYNAGGRNNYGGSIGLGAAVIKSNWGPLNEVITISRDEEDLINKVGTGKGPEVVNQAFKGGALVMEVVRAGDGGKLAELSLDSVVLKTKYPTSRNINVTIRESLNEGEKEFIAFEGGAQIEKLVFDTGRNEVDNFINEINSYSQLFVAAKNEEEGNTVGEVLNQELTGGSDPEVTAEDYVEALGKLERASFDGITVDTEDTAIHASLHEFIKRLLRQGMRTIGLVGQKISVPFYKREEEARGFNDLAMIYVGNGLTEGQVNLDGALAAGRVLGMMVSRNYKTSLTKKEVEGSTGVYGELTTGEYTSSVKNGMLTFGLNADGRAEIVYGINTLVDPGDDLDEGWKKIRRVRTRYELIDRIAYTLDRRIAEGEGIPNSSDGLQQVITIGNGVIADMIAEGGMESGTMVIDENNPAQGDSAWFGFEDLVDLDGIEKLYLAFGFQY